jgi:ABC-type branched-subunit amino acid transport system permease subunit
VIVLGVLLLALAGGIAAWFGSATPLGAVVFQLHPPFLNTLQAGVQRRLAPELWNDVFLPVLEQPGWLVPALLGALLLLIGLLRRRRRRR